MWKTYNCSEILLLTQCPKLLDLFGWGSISVRSQLVCISWTVTHFFFFNWIVYFIYLFIFIYLFFSFIFISWRLITLQYCSGFCHTLTWISHGVTCIPYPDSPSHLPLYPIPLGLPSCPLLNSSLPKVLSYSLTIIQLLKCMDLIFWFWSLPSIIPSDYVECSF